MISKAELKNISKLLLKKYRKQEGKFLAEGKRLVEEALNSNTVCEKIITTESYIENDQEILKKIKDRNIAIVFVNAKDFLKISSTKNSQNIAGIFKKLLPKSNYNDENSIIALENISDPGNLGAILRSCDWFGINTILLSTGCAELYNPKVVRASMGAIFNLNIIENLDIYDELRNLKKFGFLINVADMNGTNYREFDWSKKTITVFCNEANGVSEELLKICDSRITIPKKGNIDSLNVSAAAAVILSQIKS